MHCFPMLLPWQNFYFNGTTHPHANIQGLRIAGRISLSQNASPERLHEDG